jgi:hypothetical protein
MAYASGYLTIKKAPCSIPAQKGKNEFANCPCGCLGWQVAMLDDCPLRHLGQGACSAPCSSSAICSFHNLPRIVQLNKQGTLEKRIQHMPASQGDQPNLVIRQLPGARTAVALKPRMKPAPSWTESECAGRRHACKNKRVLGKGGFDPLFPLGRANQRHEGSDGHIPPCPRGSGIR